MAAIGVVLRQPLRLPSSAAGGVPASKHLRFSSAPIYVGPRRRPNIGIKSSGFRDRGHVEYYNSNLAPSSPTTAAGGKKEDKAMKKTKKKQLKLAKGLFRDLSAFSQVGFGLSSDGSLLDQVKRKMIAEASEFLLKELHNLKAEEREHKRKMKQEKARSKAGQNRKMSSSDSECGEITNNLEKQVIEEATALAYPPPTIPTITTAEPDEERAPLCSNGGIECCLKKIEVCMGGKCKKLGAEALMNEFGRAVGVDGVVSECKCMGKCRDGPNVKVLDTSSGDKPGTNSLCIGVGLQDVGMILESFFCGGKDS